MSTGNNNRRPFRVILGLLLVVALIVALVVYGPGLLRSLREGENLLPWPAECTVQTAEGEVGLSRDEAKLATTAVALGARGTETPDTSGIDDAVLQRLAEGSPEDAGPSLICRGAAASNLLEEQMTASGLTPRAEQVRAAMAEVFGELPLGGFTPGGFDYGHGEDSTHYDGRAIDVFFRPVTEENRRAGWRLAHWLIAHADELHIQYVIFDDRIWSAHSFRGQWRDYRAPEPANEILRHLDHVHVDVLGGGPE
ncbi:hypothetical protein [Corynebacterium halotolerans]|uniref:hypothetical protein n=1 Tax=Corynebacterium halotolerans TaxID=225326 RepID=UPI003CEF5F70